MAVYPASARERAMKVQEVILRALNKQITFWEAAHIAGISPRHLRRLYERYRRLGFDGLYDRRKGQPSAKRVPWRVVEQVLGLYREKYFDFSVRHFHEKLRAEHGIAYSYTCIKRLLQGAGLVVRARKRGPHRRKRERRPMQESTATVLVALREVVEQRGIFCALYSDRGSHFWLTPKEGEIVDRQRLTQVGRAMRDLGIEMIPAYSPQARGRSERNFRTWQGRLPQELRLRGITTVEEANRFLGEHYIAELNRKFSIAAAQPESAFVPATGRSLERIFSLQHDRVVNQDNTVRIANRTLQIEKTPWRNTLAKCHVQVCEHLDGTWSVFYGPHRVGRYAADGSRYRSTESSLPERGNPAPPAGFPLSTATAAEERPDTRTGQIMC